MEASDEAWRRADYLIERGYVLDMDIDQLAEKIEISLQKEREKKEKDVKQNA